MNVPWGDFGLFLLPYALTFLVGFVLGFMSRNSRVDRLGADLKRAQAEAAGTEIRTSREPEPAVQLPPGLTSLVRPGHRTKPGTARTAPLPTGVRYVPADVQDVPSPGTHEDDDRPVSDVEYVQLMSGEPE
jgi:hypothetical protein